MPEATIGALSSADVAAIRSVSNEFAKLMIAGDFDSLIELYTDDAVFMPPDQPAVRGRSALRSWMSYFPRISAFTLSIEEIDGRADLAYVRGTYTMTMHPEGAPQPVRGAGKYIEIRKRQPDGSWLLSVDIFNSDQP
jgi:ketosteroid isomerase-like protein